ncbi:MAG: hypothetical protein J0I80_08185 [Sphingomonas sp.]|nr:hypothetical protein [Sphingomonas sp.]
MPFQSARGQAFAHHQPDGHSVSLSGEERLVIVEAGQSFVVRSIRDVEAQARLARPHPGIAVGTGTKVDAALFRRTAQMDREAADAAR